MRVFDLFRWHGTIGRGAYALTGVVLFLIKLNLDRAIGLIYFQANWHPFLYFTPRWSAEFLVKNPEELYFHGVVLVLAIPFLWIGVALTAKRLRDTGLPLWLTTLFFVPFLNLLFFSWLTLAPSNIMRPDSYNAPLKDLSDEPHDTGVSHTSNIFLDRVIPDHALGSAALGCFVTTVFGTLMTGFAVSRVENYGWGLFVGIPFFSGLISVLIYGYHRPRRIVDCIGVGLLSVLLLGAVLFALAIEGIICLIMAAPIAAVAALLGACIGFSTVKARQVARQSTSTLGCYLFLLPGLLALEADFDPEPPLYAVKTQINIAAPPETVWRHVVRFPPLPEPTSWILKTGIAYPIGAEIDGQGIGAIRRCSFSTGDFVEPIQIWDEPRLLRFSVTENPPPMQEWSIYSSIHPPHLTGFLVSEAGQFRLTALPDGGTQLEGTTWYRHHIQPAGYWKIFSQCIISSIHLEVLQHVKRCAEAKH